jgi:dihydrofolate synthase/folylpolyglutamate synthase
MNLSEEIGRIESEYPGRGPRGSLDAVGRLRDRLDLGAPVPAIGVVGTNGKTSTATYLSRLLSASGVRTGLYTSPHLSEWTERIRVEDEPCDPRALVEALDAVHEVAQASGELADLRFFDILTLAAERLLGDAGVDLAVFEAGIGGRLDAVRLLEPRIVLLTGIGIDHVEMLGETPREILTEKLLAAPPGATVLSFRLGVELDELASEIAAERELQLSWVEPNPGEPLEAPTFLRDALAMAEAGQRAAAGLFGTPPPKPRPVISMWSPGFNPIGIDLALPGRFERGKRGEVPFLLDGAHNEAAWQLLVFELRRMFGEPPEAPPYVALVSVSPAKRREGLADALCAIPGMESVIATRHTALPAEDPQRLAEEFSLAGLDACAVEDVDAAVALAFERASESGRVLALGSIHLVGDVRRWLDRVAATSETG